SKLSLSRLPSRHGFQGEHPAMLKFSLIPASLVLFFGTWSFADTKLHARIIFEDQIRPILKAHCFECHGEGKKLKGGLDVRLRRLVEKGGESGPALKVGKHQDSLLFKRVASKEMPPGKKKLTADEIALIGRWIDEGANT